IQGALNHSTVMDFLSVDGGVEEGLTVNQLNREGTIQLLNRITPPLRQGQNTPFISSMSDGDRSAGDQPLALQRLEGSTNDTSGNITITSAKIGNFHPS
ncbi:hypothetical protein, partial [Escherichia coli]|uniref:hypothetical protein n=1 Tax=Escherichia coli TaxID=562 RepID=UPI002452ECB0